MESPSGFVGRAVLEGADLPIAALYFDGSAILPKPDRPSDLYEWDRQTHEWVAPQQPLPFTPQQNWEELLAQLRGSAFFAKCFNAAERTLKANAAWTLLYGTLTRTHNLEDLQFSLYKMREALSGIAAIGDFTPEEVEALNQMLEQTGFELRL